MKTKILKHLFVIPFIFLGCDDSHTYPEEIVFDPDVSETQTNIGQSVIFTDYSTGVKSRTWTFPGGNPETSSDQQVEVSFSEVGLINCTIENTFSDGSTETKDIFVQVGSGLINYNVSSVQTDPGSSITFVDNSNSVASRLWTFPGGNPSTSTDPEVEVTFPFGGPVICTLEVTFLNNVIDTQEIQIQVGTEQYPRTIFGFEDTEGSLEVWESWVSNGTDAMEFSVENSPGGGALGSNGFGKIIINQAAVESQLYTKGIEGFPNGTLQSNTTYEFSFYIKSNDFSTVTAAEVSNQSSEQNWNNFAWYSPIPEVESDWSFKTITFVTGDLTQIYSEGTANNAWTQFKFIQPGTGVIYIDEISLKAIQ